MGPSILTMGFFMSEINFCNTKEQLNHLGEVVTGKVDGSPTGADIDTSTLPYTGQVRKTLPALQVEYQDAIRSAGGKALNSGVWASGQTFTAYNQYMVYNDVPYKPLATTTLPYGPTGATPDSSFVGPYVEYDYGTIPSGITVKHRRGSDSEIEQYTLDAAEIALNETDNSIHVGDSVTPGGVKQLNENNVNTYVRSQPSIPPATNTSKLIMRPSGESGFYVVTKRARDRGGYIMTLVRDDVAAADSSNTGGLSNNRPSVINNCQYVYVANSVASATSGDVTLPTLSSTFINSVWRYTDSSSNFSYFSESVDTSENNLQNRKLYNVNSGSGSDYVEFRTYGDCTVHLGSSSGSSEDVDIQIVDDTGVTLYTAYSGLNLRQTGSLPSIGLIKGIKRPIADATGYYRVRVVNKSTEFNSACYVAGLSISLLSDVPDGAMITNAVALRATAAPKYRSSSGANEFAAKEVGGKFFGTFHGGHSNIFERLRVSGGANYDVQADAVPDLLLTSHVTLYSSSTLTPDSANCTYEYLLTVRFADGMDVATHSINLKSGVAVDCSDAYTHMCASDNDFTRVYQPVLINSLSDVNTPVGDEQTIEQYNDMGLTIASYFSKVNVSDNIFNGAYIQDTSNFNKQYYGPIVSGDSKFIGGTFITCKEYF